ncbi:MAG: hypothetical protein ACOX0M_00615 [Salinivirgaceae bacterium]|jgi:hypothetical protein|nr:hypothetical protein [Bacteroidales bacterium]
MIRHIINIILLSILLSNVVVKNTFSQERKVYDRLSGFSNWSLVAGPVLYKKAEIRPQYGNLTFKNKPILGFNAGILYGFNSDKMWSFQTGTLLAMEPTYSFAYEIQKYDLFDSYQGNLTDSYKSYAFYSLSFPLLLSLNLQTSKNTFASLLIGSKIMYFPYGQSEYVYTVIDEELSESREIFGLKLESQKNAFQGSFVLGTGFSYALQKILLKANLIYVFNLQNTITGEYQFANLFVSADTRGDYNLSGNYLGLLFSISFNKFKKEEIFWYN